MLRTICDPVIMLFKRVVRDQFVIIFFRFSRLDQAVRLGPVAATMSEL